MILGDGYESEHLKSLKLLHTTVQNKWSGATCSVPAGIGQVGLILSASQSKDLKHLKERRLENSDKFVASKLD